MDKQYGWVRSAGICILVSLLMIGTAYFLVTGENETMQTGSKVEAAYLAQTEENANRAAGDKAEGSLAEETDGTGYRFQLNLTGGTDNGTTGSDPAGAEAAAVDSEKDDAPAVMKAASSGSADQAKAAPAEKKEEDVKTPESQPVQAATEQPAASPAPAAEEAEVTVSEPDPAPVPEPEPAPAVTTAPVTYRWGSASSYTFRMEVRVTNNGSDTSRNVNVSVPLLENRSPYQTTSLAAVNYTAVSSSGRVSTFNIGDLAPGETKTIRADFAITARPVSIQSSNDTVDKARIAYNQYAGSGNCRTLARGFISKARELGVEAREVIGFARPQRGPMTSGSLAGTRHSWAEFYVDGLGWVPVDLTFQYFGEFPHASHIVESYADQSIKVNYTGGSLSASWSNLIL